MQHPDSVLSKHELEDRLCAFGGEVESNTVEVHVSRLRKKLSQSVIETEWGVNGVITGHSAGVKLGQLCGWRLKRSGGDLSRFRIDGVRVQLARRPQASVGATCCRRSGSRKNNAYPSTSSPVGTGTFSLSSFSPAASATVSIVAAKSFSR